MIELATAPIKAQLPTVTVDIAVPSKNKKSEEKPFGRPTVMTKDTLQKLEDAFMNDYTDLEACHYAGISKSTLYNYQRENPDFMERKEALQKLPNMAAKKELVAGIKGNLEQARWWANNKMGSEYGAKSTVQHVVEMTHVLDPALATLNQDYNKKHRELIIKRIATKAEKGEVL